MIEVIVFNTSFPCGQDEESTNSTLQFLNNQTKHYSLSHKVFIIKYHLLEA